MTSVLVVGAGVTGALTAASKGTAPSPIVVVAYLLIVASAALIAALSIRAARGPASPSRLGVAT